MTFSEAAIGDTVSGMTVLGKSVAGDDVTLRLVPPIEALPDYLSWRLARTDPYSETVTGDGDSEAEIPEPL